MPYTIFAPAKREDGTWIIDQQGLRQRWENRPVDYDELNLERIRQQKAQAEAQQEFEAATSAAGAYGLDPEEVSFNSSNMEVAHMLERDLSMQEEFENTLQERAAQVSGPDAVKLTREMSELNTAHDTELYSYALSDETARAVVMDRNMAFRSKAAEQLKQTIKTKQNEYFEQVNRKSDAHLAKQMSGLDAVKMLGCLAVRENEMRALGKTDDEIVTGKSALAARYFESQAGINPESVLAALKGLSDKLEKTLGKTAESGDSDATNPTPNSELSEIAKFLPEKARTKLVKIAEKARTRLEYQQKATQLNQQQNEILQDLAGLGIPEQREELARITAEMEDKEAAETLQTRIGKHLDEQKKQENVKTWELLEQFRNSPATPLQKLNTLATLDSLEPELREQIAREALGETTPATPKNAKASLDLLKQISKGELRALPDLQAQFISQNLTRDQRPPSCSNALRARAG